MIPNSIYLLFAWAIENRKRIVCSYARYPREICPIILGFSDGREAALVYQVGG